MCWMRHSWKALQKAFCVIFLAASAGCHSRPSTQLLPDCKSGYHLVLSFTFCTTSAACNTGLPTMLAGICDPFMMAISRKVDVHPGPCRWRRRMGYQSSYNTLP
mmetsp:Transcript_70741/g.124794  ORF Transcript_70741/g.124794 Transcript_70741/m.124794 type:complete len:104 (+) Transcript_70741:73-384(+)